MYGLTNYSVKPENIAYPSRSGNNLQVTLNADAEIEEFDEDLYFPPIFLKFVSLVSVQNAEKNITIGKCLSIFN